MRARAREGAPTGQTGTRPAPQRLNAAVLSLSVTYDLRAWMRCVRTFAALLTPVAILAKVKWARQRQLTLKFWCPQHAKTPSQLGA